MIFMVMSNTYILKMDYNLLHIFHVLTSLWFNRKFFFNGNFKTQKPILLLYIFRFENKHLAFNFFRMIKKVKLSQLLNY